MYRTIDLYLEKWKNRKNRKVLLVRGARQVGKTYAVRVLGEQFENFVEVNFDSDLKVKKFFEESLNPTDIIRDIEYFYDIKITPGKTLLFFDEIQECENAIRALRYFYEKMPELHVIAAGSLLEFTLSDIPSFGVGRIESLYLYPMSFHEFVQNVKGMETAEIIKNASFNQPIHRVLHEKLLEELKMFQLIGGMPEVVQHYIDEKNARESQRILNILIKGYETDFSKYKKRSPVARLRETMKSIADQSGAKFKYSNVGEDTAKLYKDALELLVRAGLVHLVYHTSASGIPLGATLNIKRFKAVLFDSGIYQKLMNFNLSDYVVQDFKELINKGALAEVFIANEIIKSQDMHTIPELYYWHREAKSSLAEVDYVIERNNQIIPIEVKSGLGRKMKSMRLFLEKKSSSFGIRFSADNFSIEGNIISIPLYAVESIENNVNHFINDF